MKKNITLSTTTNLSYPRIRQRRILPCLPAGRSLTGFTLMELLVVLIIIGVLAAIGLPNFLKDVESSKAKQAIEYLNLMRNAEIRYYIETDSSTYTNNFNDLDTSPLATGKIYWTFSIVSANNTGFLIQAERDGGPEDNYTVTLNQTGSWGGNHSGVPNN